MAIDLSSEKSIYDGIKEHEGHKIVAIGYGMANMVIECHDCGMILVSGDNMIPFYRCENCGEEFDEKDGDVPHAVSPRSWTSQ